MSDLKKETKVDDGAQVHEIQAPASENSRTETELNLEKSETIDPDALEDIKNEQYSVFSIKEKYFIVLLTGFTSFWSAISAPIFYPILDPVKQQFNLNEEIINLAVVIYFIFQGVSPMFIASIADKIGRKPAYLFCCLIYVIADVIIATSKSFGEMLVFRCFQAIGISPVIALNSGVCADLNIPSKRGKLLGLSTSIQLMAQSIGGLVGSLLTYRFKTWASVFWFLAIGCGVNLFLSFFLLPETKRSIVGDGSVKPKKLMNMSPVWLIPHFRKKQVNNLETLEKPNTQPLLLKLMDVPRIIFHKEIALVLYPSALFYTSWTMSLTAMSTVLSSEYGFSILKIGLCFLAPGIGGTCGSLLCGRMLDLFYKMYNKKHKRAVDKYKRTKKCSLNGSSFETSGDLERNEKEPEFDHFKCRLPVMFPYGIVNIFGLLLFGWSLNNHLSLPPILIGSFLICLTYNPFNTVSISLIIDLYPSKSSTGAACVNFSRCLIAACGVAALSKMTASMGVGGCFTLMAGLCAAGLVPIYVTMLRGTHWRKQDALKKAKKEEVVNQNQQQAVSLDLAPKEQASSENQIPQPQQPLQYENEVQKQQH